MKIEKDKVKHAACCYGAVIVPCFIALIHMQWMTLAFFLGIGLSIGAALGKEYGDYTHTGAWNWKDLIADAIGFIVGVATGYEFFVMPK